MRSYSLWILSLAAVCTLGGCQLLRTERSSTQFESQLTKDQLVLHTDFPLPKQHRLIDDLLVLRDQLCEKLLIPYTDEPIHVYLYENEAAYHDFLNLRFPDFAGRRAIFVETDVKLTVYAHWGDHVAEDLRHEVAHGYLHSAVPNLPLWLDEGLAEYFEVGRGKSGRNQLHIDLLTAQANLGNWKPELTRLEQLSSAVEMTQQDYAESWAWVHFLLESEGDKTELLTDYLADLRQGAAGASLSMRLEKRLAAPKLALIEHLESLR